MEGVELPESRERIVKANGVDLTGKPALTPDMLSTIVIHP